MRTTDRRDWLITRPRERVIAHIRPVIDYQALASVCRRQFSSTRREFRAVLRGRSTPRDQGRAVHCQRCAVRVQDSDAALAGKFDRPAARAWPRQSCRCGRKQRTVHLPVGAVTPRQRRRDGALLGCAQFGRFASFQRNDFANTDANYRLDKSFRRSSIKNAAVAAKRFRPDERTASE